jgi:hypothetical protein
MQHAETQSNVPQRNATQRDASSLGKSRQLLGVRRANYCCGGNHCGGNRCRGLMSHIVVGIAVAASCRMIGAACRNATRRALMSHYWTRRNATCRNATQRAATQRDATQRDEASLGKSRQLLHVRRAFGGTFGRRGLMSHTSRHIYACRPHPPKILIARVKFY